MSTQFVNSFKQTCAIGVLLIWALCVPWVASVPGSGDATSQTSSSSVFVPDQPGLHTLTTSLSSPLPTSFPTNYGVVVFPAFELIEVFGPLDVLKLLSRDLATNVYLIADTKDAVTTQSTNPSDNPFNSSHSAQILPTHTFSDAPDLDVLIVPGSLDNDPSSQKDAIDFIAKTHSKLQYLITVGTGSTLAAQAGILDGRNATTSKAVWESATKLGPNVHWVGHARWVVDGNIWSASGGTAGLDAILAFLEHFYGVSDMTDVSDLMEYQRHPDSEWDPYAIVYNVPDT